jgi:hypothetical protein
VNVWVSEHAAERFVERVRPTLAKRAASIELARLCREFGVVVERPAFLHEDAMTGIDFWLEVAPGVVVACAESVRRWPVALTVVCCGHVSEANREHRNRRRAGRASHRARTLAGRDAPKWRRPGGPSEDEWAA